MNAHASAKRFGFFTLILFFLSLSSCYKKDQEIRLEGSISDPVLGIPLSGVSLVLSSNKVSSGIYSSGYTEITQVISDAQGKFILVFNKEKTDSYRFLLTKTSYFEQESIISAPDIEQSNTNLKFTLKPKAGLKLRIKNTNPWDNFDLISWQINNATQTCFQCCNNTINKGYGSNFDTTITCNTIGNKSLVITSSSTKNGSTLIRIDTVFCPVFQTTQHNIFY